MEVAGANRRWRCQFRCRGSRREPAVAQLFSLGHVHHRDHFLACCLGWPWRLVEPSRCAAGLAEVGCAVRVHAFWVVVVFLI
jgi:hypothetical protein